MAGIRPAPAPAVETKHRHPSAAAKISTTTSSQRLCAGAAQAHVLLILSIAFSEETHVRYHLQLAESKNRQDIIIKSYLAVFEARLPILP